MLTIRPSDPTGRLHPALPAAAYRITGASSNAATTNIGAPNATDPEIFTGTGNAARNWKRRQALV